MEYTTYKFGMNSGSKTKPSYTREELESLDLSQLKEILYYENIKTPSTETLSDKESLIKIIFRYKGAASDKLISEFDANKAASIENTLAKFGMEQGSESIQIPARLKIYKGLDSLSSRGDEYNIKVTQGELKETHAFLIDGKKKIQAILTVSQGEYKGDYALTLPEHLISPELAPGNYSNFSLIFIRNYTLADILRAYDADKSKAVKSPYFSRVPVTEVIVEDIPETEDVLVIDYGSSYTTAATFKDGVRRVVFPSGEKCEVNVENNAGVLCENCGKCCLYPSAVAIKHCGGGNVEFMFGHIANAEAKKRGYTARNSIFYDTKRWVNSYQDLIEVVDFSGNSYKIKKQDIIREFLLHVIKTAEQQNKVRYTKLYFTYPVKQRGLFRKMFKDVLPDYRIIQDGVLDEAMAVVYGKSIAAAVENPDLLDDGEQTSVLIIDCGGGTTDMVRCDYIMQGRSELTTKIDISVGYARGDTNFGGNNLTYRILQLLKIKFAEYYSKIQPIPVNTLFESVSADVYGFVDAHGAEQAYADFEKRYETAESVIPTAFVRYQSSIELNYLRVRGNYFFLWNLAETMKKEFFNKSTYKYSFNKTAQKKGVKAGVYNEPFNLSVKNENGQIELRTEYPDVEITRDEIYTVLKPDIYKLVKSFVEPYYDDGSLEDINAIFLSGQTSKIEIFREVLKEYIAGRKAKADTTNSYTKKLWCVSGAASYQSAKEFGKIDPVLDFVSPKVPYNLTAEVFSGGRRDEKYLIKAGDILSDIYAYVSRVMTAEKVEFTLKNEDGGILNKLMIRIDTNSYRKTDYEELLGQYSVFRQADIDGIEDNEVRIFVFSDGDGWGFSTLEVARAGDSLFCGELRYFPFENEQWEKNFFDGLK